jgi:hypothetical protein
MILNAIVVLTVALTGDTCASIDNRTNTAVWAKKHPAGIEYHRTRYSDMDRIIYHHAPAPTDNASWMALHAAERALQQGVPGHKIPVRCVDLDKI